MDFKVKTKRGGRNGGMFGCSLYLIKMVVDRDLRMWLAEIQRRGKKLKGIDKGGRSVMLMMVTEVR